MDPDDVPRPRQRVSQRRRLVQRAPDDRIDDLEPVMTVVGGTIVFEAAGR